MFELFKNLKQKIEIVRWLHNSKPLVYVGKCRPQRLLDDYIGEKTKKEIERILADLKKNLDDKSLESVDAFFSVHYIPMSPYIKNIIVEFNDRLIEDIPTTFEVSAREKWNLFAFNELDPKVFFYHHGLKLLGTACSDYVQNKIFIDAGACYGDSTLVLSQYHPSKIYAFEPSEHNLEIYKKVMQKNSIPPELYEIFQMGLGKENKTVAFADSKNAGNSLCHAGKDLCKIVRLDDFMWDKKGNIGFLKADVEGYGLDLVQGAVETLKRDRPILDISIYHSGSEFFGVKPFLESLNLDYAFQIRHLTKNPYVEYELLAYPKELASSVSSPVS